MSADRTPTAAEAATHARFVDVVSGAGTSYPSGSELVRADLPDLSKVISENVGNRRTTVIVHDDGSEVIVDPPDWGKVATFIVLMAFAFLHHRSERLEASGEVVELPVGSRVRLRQPPTALAA